jgi:hypothetical protein
MSHPLRQNAYGETIAPLVDARFERIKHNPANEQAIVALQAILGELWDRTLCRGWYGGITIEIVIKDGIIAQDVSLIDKTSRRLRE